MSQLLRRRFEELNAQADDILKTKAIEHDEFGLGHEYVNREQFLAWCVKVKNLLISACGQGSEHYKAFVEAENYQSWSGNTKSFSRAQAVFGAAKEDFDGGYLISVRNLIQAEVFDTELEQAKELLSANYYSAAAVITGVVLETSLRQLAITHGIPIGKLDRMNADLAKAGHYNSLVQKCITTLAAIRNSAAHGDNSAFSQADVASMIEEVARIVNNFLS